MLLGMSTSAKTMRHVASAASSNERDDDLSARARRCLSSCHFATHDRSHALVSRLCRTTKHEAAAGDGIRRMGKSSTTTRTSARLSAISCQLYFMMERPRRAMRLTSAGPRKRQDGAG